MSSAIMPRPLRRSSCAWQEMIFRYAPCARVSGLFAGSASRSSARTSCLSVRRDAVLSRIDRGRRPSRHRVIRAHDGVGGDVFDLFFRQLADERKASVTVATGDGAGWIDSRVAEHCPNAERVPDGFRIVSWMTGALDKVGKRLWNQARHGHDEEAAGRMRGARYTVPKNPDADRRAVGGIRKPATHGPQGPALPFMAARGTAAHPARAPPTRPGES